MSCSKLCRYIAVCGRGQVPDECPAMSGHIFKPTTKEVEATIGRYLPCPSLEEIASRVRKERETIRA